MWQNKTAMQQARMRRKRSELEETEKNADPLSRSELPQTFAQELDYIVVRPDRYEAYNLVREAMKLQIGNSNFSPVSASISANGKTWCGSDTNTPTFFYAVNSDTKPEVREVLELQIPELVHLEDVSRRVKFFGAGLLGFPVTSTRLQNILPKTVFRDIRPDIFQALDMHNGHMYWDSNTTQSYKTYLKQMQPVLDEMKEREFWRVACQT